LFGSTEEDLHTSKFTSLLQAVDKDGTKCNKKTRISYKIDRRKIIKDQRIA